MTKTLQGRCFCKAVRFEIEPPVTSCVNCHCESCRRQCSAPMVTYVGIPNAQWRWTGDAPKVFNSSPGVERTFCGACGTPLSFRSDKLSSMMHFYLNALENPGVFEPTLHVAHEEKLEWLKLADGLPVRNGPSYL